MAAGWTIGMVVVAFLAAKGSRRRDDDDEVDVQSNHLRREFLKPLRAALCIAPLNDEVLSLHIAKFAEAFEQRAIKFLISVRDKPDPPNFARLLCTCTERPGSGRSPDETNEFASFHCITPMPTAGV
jgi:hypothetical protein